MKCLDKSACEKWCGDRSILVRANEQLSYASGQNAIEIPVPKFTQGVVDLAYALLAREQDEIPFGGALLWFSDWDIWSESIEQYAMKMWRNMRLAYGEKMPFNEAPGHLFNADEFVDAQGFFLIPLMFQWDAFWIPNHGDYFAFASHDEILFIFARTSEVREKLLERYKPWLKGRQPN
jgi:hypothetical protein